MLLQYCWNNLCCMDFSIHTYTSRTNIHTFRSEMCHDRRWSLDRLDQYLMRSGRMLKRMTIHYKFFILNSWLEMLSCHSRITHETIDSILLSLACTYRGLVVRDNSQKLRSRAIDLRTWRHWIEEGEEGYRMCVREIQLVPFLEDSLRKFW